MPEDDPILHIRTQRCSEQGSHRFVKATLANEQRVAFPRTCIDQSAPLTDREWRDLEQRAVFEMRHRLLNPFLKLMRKAWEVGLAHGSKQMHAEGLTLTQIQELAEHLIVSIDQDRRTGA